MSCPPTIWTHGHLPYVFTSVSFFSPLSSPAQCFLLPWQWISRFDGLNPCLSPPLIKNLLTHKRFIYPWVHLTSPLSCCGTLLTLLSLALSLPPSLCCPSLWETLRRCLFRRFFLGFRWETEPCGKDRAALRLLYVFLCLERNKNKPTVKTNSVCFLVTGLVFQS